MSGLLVIFSGPSGVGKTTITRAVIERVAGAQLSVSATTRPIRDKEVDGVDYFFVGKDEFARMEQAGEMLETARVFDNFYGTPATWVRDRLDEGKVVVLEIDVQGAILVRRRIPEAFGIFILPPSEAELLQRLRDRKREPEEVIQRRFAEAQHEIAAAKSSGAYDRFITNDDLDRAIVEAVGAVEAQRGKGE